MSIFAMLLLGVVCKGKLAVNLIVQRTRGKNSAIGGLNVNTECKILLGKSPSKLIYFSHLILNLSIFYVIFLDCLANLNNSQTEIPLVIPCAVNVDLPLVIPFTSVIFFLVYIV